MRIAVIGAGAIGGYFGGRLVQAGEEVAFLARGGHLDILRTEGLRIAAPDGSVHLKGLTVTDRPQKIGPVDAILFCVKGWQVSEAAGSIGALVGPETFALPLQNGVEAADRLAGKLGKEHVLGGMCRIIARLEKPGHVTHVGVRPFISFGELDNRSSGRVKKFQAVLENAGISARVPTDIHAAVWEKFLMMVAVSGLGALTRVPIGTIRGHPESRQLLERAMQEAFQVGKARGIALADDQVEKTMDFLDTLPAEGIPSMQRDITAGRPSELEDQNGAVVRLGRLTGVSTPINDFIYHCLLPLERRARGEAAPSPGPGVPLKP